MLGAAASGISDGANPNVAYGRLVIPAGVRSRFIDGVNGLRVHVLEAGFEGGNQPCLLLLHGFPELALVWSKVMLPLAAAGYRVVAPDLRGFGRTTGWDGNYDTDLRPFGTLNMVRDTLGLVRALGYSTVRAVIGRDAGSPLAAWCAMLRPDIFRAAVMMTAPFAGAPSMTAGAGVNLDAQFAALTPPRKHYTGYYSTREAEGNMMSCPLGLKEFFRGYFFQKSADWKENAPVPLPSRTGAVMARMPRYYIMDRAKGMCETVSERMPTAEERAACQWLSEAELDVFAEEYGRTGFQGGLNYYRRSADARMTAELEVFSGRTIDVPSAFIGGTKDWGVHQTPGALEAMRTRVCTQMTGVHMVPDAGHWVQQEKPEEVSRLLLGFVRALR